MPVGASDRRASRSGGRPASGIRGRTTNGRTISMSMSEPDLALLIATVALSLGLIACVVTLRLARRLGTERTRAADLRQQLELVRQSISGLTAGAVGMDRRMQRLESREKALSERQETYENQQADEQPYGHAIRLVQQGAGVNRLVDELGLSESEADLSVRLHGQRDTA